MTAKKAPQGIPSRRSAFHESRDVEKPDPTPVEIPVAYQGHKSISQEIQDQIAIQIAKKK